MANTSRVTARGERTREHLIDVAEQLLSVRGVESVSLREIRLAAGQRNTSALQFHFGDREGLVRAIADRHRPVLAERLRGLHHRMLADGRTDDRSLVEVFVRPVADYVFEGPSPRAWVRIAAELAARPELDVHDFVDHASEESLEVGATMLDRLERTMPRRYGFQRIFMMMLATLHLCADRARIEGAESAGRRHMPQQDFVENVVDMATAALFAPHRTIVDETTPAWQPT
jgi:AcrR family transcriptional regulator